MLVVVIITILTIIFGELVPKRLGQMYPETVARLVARPMNYLSLATRPLVLALPDWQAMAQRLQAAGTEFLFAPQVRFEGLPGEQWTMFFCDPFGNPLEIKGFRDLDAVYAS